MAFLATLAAATPYNLTSFLSAFQELVTAIVGAWGSVLGVILDTANFIMIIPVMVYIFVVVTSSLRSFYKG